MNPRFLVEREGGREIEEETEKVISEWISRNLALIQTRMVQVCGAQLGAHLLESEEEWRLWVMNDAILYQRALEDGIPI